MTRRKALWICLGATLALWIGCGLWSGLVASAALATFLVLPVCGAVYAAELGRGAFNWWVLGLLLPGIVPLALALQRREPEIVASPRMPVGGRPALSYGLGDPVACHPRQTDRLLVLYVIVLAASLPLAALLSLSLGTALGPGGQDRLILASAAALAIGLVLLVRWYEMRASDRLVALFPEGLVSVAGGQAEVIRWSEVAAVYQKFSDQYVNGIRTRHQRDCVLRLTSGAERTFGSALRDIEGLTVRIHEHTAQRLVPRLSALLDAGGTVPFGKLQLGPDGIACKGDLLAWERVAGVTLDRGYVVVSRITDSAAEAALRRAATGVAALVTSFVGRAQPRPLDGQAVAWRRVSIADTPNVLVLRELVTRKLERAEAEVVVRAG